MLELQLRKKIELVEQEILDLLVDDPTMYYEGDFDELWDARKILVSHLARFHPERQPLAPQPLGSPVRRVG